MKKRFYVFANANASGEPDVFFCTVECTEQQHIDGDSYEMAKKIGIDNDYDGPFIAFSEDDTIGKKLMKCGLLYIS